MSESRTISSEQVEKYVQQRGTCCPYCDREDRGGGFVEIDTGTAWQDVSCFGCGNSWRDIYHLVSMAILA